MANVIDQDQQWLLNCLSATLDPNQEVRSFAETSLNQASLQPGHNDPTSFGCGIDSLQLAATSSWFTAPTDVSASGLSILHHGTRESNLAALSRNFYFRFDPQKETKSGGEFDCFCDDLILAIISGL
ncbi:hypothetical protein SDJN02_25824, partial [Cucurbita argyrosperma subsp. argyrosperma]